MLSLLLLLLLLCRQLLAREHLVGYLPVANVCKLLLLLLQVLGCPCSLVVAHLTIDHLWWTLARL